MQHSGAAYLYKSRARVRVSGDRRLISEIVWPTKMMFPSLFRQRDLRAE
jgi:hypothetical protein